MPVTTTVKVVFTCDRTHESAVAVSVECPVTVNEAYTRHECAQKARSIGWRILDETYMFSSKVLCPACNQSSICEHGYDASWPEHKTCNGR